MGKDRVPEKKVSKVMNQMAQYRLMNSSNAPKTNQNGLLYNGTSSFTWSTAAKAIRKRLADRGVLRFIECPEIPLRDLDNDEEPGRRYEIKFTDERPDHHQMVEVETSNFERRLRRKYVRMREALENAAELSEPDYQKRKLDLKNFKYDMASQVDAHREGREKMHETTNMNHFNREKEHRREVAVVTQVLNMSIDAITMNTVSDDIQNENTSPTPGRSCARIAVAWRTARRTSCSCSRRCTP
jgi:hypothetical protein